MKISMIKILSFLLIVNGLIFSQNKQPLVKTFSATDGENLDISIDPGNIDIQTWEKNEVNIEVVSKKKYEIENIISEKVGKTIKFHLELEDGWNNNVTVKVKTPSNFNFKLNTTGGNINIENAITGKLSAETDGGNINFNNVKGEVSVNTSGGNINGKDVEGDVNLHTNGGNISLGNVKSGKSNIDTYGGNISVGNVTSDLFAKTQGGNISIGDVGGNANVFTYGGHIKMDKVTGSATMETYGGHLTLQSASGKVVAKTMGGHINLENITGSIEASTEGGHVNAELDPKSNTNSSLRTSGGNMELKVPASAKTTIEVFIETDEFEKDEVEEILQSDFPSAKFNADGDDGKINATYNLNGGGSKISLKCIGGNVSIKKWNK
ncbi:MAG: hypothetical protein IPM32_03770 [Ignavibacteriae bacterium]|nr:hypothetical protein [Ignavibacteriota bacterium]